MEANIFRLKHPIHTGKVVANGLWFRAPLALIKLASRIDIETTRRRQKKRLKSTDSHLRINFGKLKLVMAQEILQHPELLEKLGNGPIKVSRFSFSSKVFRPGSKIRTFTVGGKKLTINFETKGLSEEDRIYFKRPPIIPR